MSGRYVPPARRNNAATTEQKPTADTPDANLRTLEEIASHFWPLNGDGAPQFSTSSEGRTLHDSASTPGKLTYVILFANANPRWEKDKIIFTKSSLDLLPVQLATNPARAPAAGAKDDATGGPSVSPRVDEKLERTSSSAEEHLNSPIAVFKQVPRSNQTGRSFEFEGWYRIDRLTFLEPRSAELVRMMEQKWTRTDSRGNEQQEKRNQQRWEESLSHRWAVVKLKEDEATRKEYGKPEIERLPDREVDEGPKESVNEMLARLRMEGDSKETQVCEMDT